MKQVFVKQYTKNDGTVVQSHYRNIEETVNLLSQGNHKEALNLINQTLSTISEEKDSLAKVFANGVLSQDERDGYMSQLGDLQSFQQHAERYKTLSDYGLDVTESSKNLQDIFGQAPPDAFQLNASEYVFPTEFEHKTPDINTNVGLNDEMEKLGIQNIGPHVYSSAGELYRNTTMDFEDVKDNPDVKILNSYKDIENKEMQDFYKQIGVSEFDKGAIYKPNTDISKKIAQSPEIDKYIKDNIDKLGDKPLGSSTIEFGGELLDRNKTDNHLAFQHATLFNPRIENGVFKAEVADNYNFEKRKLNNVVDLSSRLNNHGYRMQEARKLKNNFYLIHIEKEL